MSSYSELMAQAKALMAQAETKRKEEMATGIATIKAKMAELGITLEDLGGSGKGKTKASKSKSEPKFKGPNGELWSGGPGRKPEWVRAVLAAGKSVEDYRI